MPRVLRITREKRFAGCAIPYIIFINRNASAQIRNNSTYGCTIPDDVPVSVQIGANTSTGPSYGTEFVIQPGKSNVALLLHTKYNFWRGAVFELIEQPFGN